MLRSVHMKLVMIMVLLILSLMAVVGAFLINSVMAFYLEEFYTQMSQVFDQSQNPALSRTLQTENSGEENGAEAVLEIMQAYSGELGLDGRSRTLYILDGGTGAYLAGTDEAEGRGLEYNSPNLTRALVEKEEGTQANIAADYMDVALPFSRGDGQYVIYILDNKKMELAKDDMYILHPLPRVNEIATEVDNDPRAAYFKQVQYGVYIRMALILTLLGIEV